MEDQRRVLLSEKRCTELFKITRRLGLLGNQEIGDYASFTTVSSGMEYTFGPGGAQVMYEGGAPRSFANQDVKWESTEQLNIGLDGNLLRYKLSFNFDYFIRKTKDMLAQVPVPGVAGIMDPPYANVGSVSNKGFEINLSYRNMEGALEIWYRRQPGSL